MCVCMRVCVYTHTHQAGGEFFTLSSIESLLQPASSGLQATSRGGAAAAATTAGGGGATLESLRHHSDYRRGGGGEEEGGGGGSQGSPGTKKSLGGGGGGHYGRGSTVVGTVTPAGEDWRIRASDEMQSVVHNANSTNLKNRMGSNHSASAHTASASDHVSKVLEDAQVA